MNRWAVVGAIAIVSLIANYAPLLNTHAEQDSCVFGPVSNEQYRLYLSKAKAKLGETPLRPYKRDLASSLDALFEAVSVRESNIYSRLAIMHAVLRAVGAEYRNTSGKGVNQGKSDPYVKATTINPSVSFSYLLDVNRLWVFAPWPRDAWVIGNLTGSYKGPWKLPNAKKPGDIAFLVNGPSFIDAPQGIDIKQDAVCPPVPDASVADNFTFNFIEKERAP